VRVLARVGDGNDGGGRAQPGGVMAHAAGGGRR